MGGVFGRDRASDYLRTGMVRTTNKFDNIMYGVLEHIGNGKYGEVYILLDIVNQKIVVYESNTLSSDSALLWNNTLRSLRSIKHSNNDNVARCLEIHELESAIDIVFECPGMGLQRFLSNISNISRKAYLIKRILQHMLSGVAYCHEFGIYHQDLKPANFMISLEGDRTQLKLTNFGLFNISEQDLSYRAPEIILLSALDNKDHYSKIADIWSIGCIFAEMVKQAPLFSTASTPKDHLISIFSLLGLPTEETWPGITNYLQEFHLDNVTFEPKNLAEEFTILGAHGVDLLSRMLCLDPEKRITVEDALTHSYFAGPKN